MERPSCSSISVLLAFALALPLGCAATATKTAADITARRGRPLQLVLPRLGGGRLDLRALRGKVVVVTLFTTWSLRSQAEASRLNQLAARFAGRGVVVTAVALDRRARSLIKTYVDFVGLRFPVGLADPQDLGLVAALGITKRVPRTLLLDRQGYVIQDHHDGQTDFRRLIKAIEEARTRKGRSRRRGREGACKDWRAGPNVPAPRRAKPTP